MWLAKDQAAGNRAALNPLLFSLHHQFLILPPVHLITNTLGVLKKCIHAQALTQELPWCLSDKKSACQCRRCKSLIPGSGRPPGEGNGNPLQYSCLKNPHGHRSLLGYSPQSHKDLDRTEATEHACMHW